MPIIEPSVIKTAQATVLYPTIAQVRASMRAMETQQAELASVVAEEHKILTHDLHRKWVITRQLFRERHWLPVASHEVAPGSAGTRLSD
jgi:hypothetical protein